MRDEELYFFGLGIEWLWAGRLGSGMTWMNLLDGMVCDGRIGDLIYQQRFGHIPSAFPQAVSHCGRRIPGANFFTFYNIPFLHVLHSQSLT
jgi:hypothetical protein